MRKFFIILISLAFLTGCSHFANKEPLGITQRVIFNSSDDSVVELITVDSWESAVMKNNKGDAYAMVRKPSANGIYLVDKNGVNIHFKDKDGILEYKKGKPLSLTLKDHVWLD